MPAHAREVIPGLPHHLYIRGNNRRLLFSSNDDRIRLLGCLQRGLEKSRCPLHQLTLMTNHIHLIVTPPEPSSLATLMQRTNQRYAQTRNKQRQASGKLFEERYGSKPIRDDDQLMATTLYADSNAFASFLCKDPLGHAWSTGPLHGGLPGSRIPADMWTPSLWYLGLGPTAEARADAYRACMTSYAATTREALLDEEVERRDVDAYELRLRRPDGTSAREAPRQWPVKRKRSR